MHLKNKPNLEENTSLINNKKIIITGGAGFIGSNLTHELARVSEAYPGSTAILDNNPLSISSFIENHDGDVL